MTARSSAETERKLFVVEEEQPKSKATMQHQIGVNSTPHADASDEMKEDEIAIHKIKTPPRAVENDIE